jgi:UPF0755 protein
MCSAVVAVIWLASPPPRSPEPRYLLITRGQSFSTIANGLEKAGIVRSARLLVWYGELTRQTTELKPGEYSFTGGETMAEVLGHLEHGDFIRVIITIPEGMTLHQIGQRLEAAGLVCDNEFDAAATDGSLPQTLGLGALGAEGFLFPATYQFSPTVHANDVLATLLQRFNEILTPPVVRRMYDLQLDQRQLVTMASIVEKEAKVPGERPVIAGVFFNRLVRHMPLQSDPTAQYNPMGEKEHALPAVHSASAFNTYVIAGLPPGPIDNPGLSSIEAVLYPAHTDYLYFVARDDGTHIFSRTLREHQEAIEELRRIRAQGASRTRASGRLG